MSNRILMFMLVNMTIFGTMLGFGKKTFFDTATRTELVELVDMMRSLFSDECFHGSLTIYARQTFQEKKISQFLFGNTPLVFSGSLIPNRASTDILADYFALPLDFYSTVCFEPKISNVSLNVDIYSALDDVCEGAYFWLHLPIVETLWNLQLRENIISAGMLPYPAGYLSTETIARAVTPTTPMGQLKNVLPPDVETVFEGHTTIGDLREPLRFGKIFGKLNMLRVADIRLQLGWRFCDNGRHQASWYALIGMPTSNRPRAEFLFEPLVGNAGRWQLGVGLNLNESSDSFLGYEECSVAFYADGYVSHLFSTKQRRSFDFKSNGPGSRYMLLAAANSPAQNLLLGGVAPTTQYQGKLAPAINYTTLDVHVSIGVQASLTAALCATWCGACITFGYSFFARSGEKLNKRSCFPSNQFTFKGDSQIYGFGPLPAQTPDALNFSQDSATINGGQGATNFAPGMQFANKNVDSPQLATDGASTVLTQLTMADAVMFGVPQQQVSGSQPAILVQDADLDLTSGILPRAISNTIFFTFEHTWSDDELCWTPYLEVGGLLEFATPSAAHNSACTQWGIWFKGGLAYF